MSWRYQNRQVDDGHRVVASIHPDAGGRVDRYGHVVAAAPDLLRVTRACRDLFVVLLPIFRAMDIAAHTKYGPGMEDIISTIKMALEKAGDDSP